MPPKSSKRQSSPSAQKRTRTNFKVARTDRRSTTILNRIVVKQQDSGALKIKQKTIISSEIQPEPVSHQETITSINESSATGLTSEFDRQPSLDTLHSATMSTKIGKKARKKQNNTVSANIQDFLIYRNSILDELLRFGGRGSHLGDVMCMRCNQLMGIIRCCDCFCRELLCAACVVDQHRSNPLHRVEYYHEIHFKHTSLKALGLRVQLGHDGAQCPKPMAGPPDFVVFDSNGPHEVTIDYCDCHLTTNTPHRLQILRAGWFPATLNRPKTAFTFRCLDFFHELTLQGKTTLYDFYQTLLRLTDNMKLRKPIYRYQEFHRVIREWRHLQMLKRAGMGHDPGGIAATHSGQLAVECPACPHPGKNLPQDWADVKADAWLYTLFLAIDANFKLKSKSRQIQDIELSPGWSYFVAPEPYQKHLAGFVDEPEINTCRNEHDAILRANTRHTPGYDVSGVVLVICARHAFVRANGAGDLQKGERYCNVDYVVLSALVAFHLSILVLSYDIACQWSKNLEKRMNTYPSNLRLDTSRVKTTCVIPRWHAEGHNQFCQTRFSFNYTPGVGKTCGEDIESTWSASNALSASIREMAPGVRHEVLDDQWGGWNFQKLVGLRGFLLRRLKEAVTMSAKHKEVFTRFSSTFSPSTIAKWEKNIQVWELDKTATCPYEETESALTLHDVQLELAKKDAEEARQGVPAAHKVSLSRFLVNALALEERQRSFRLDLARNKDKQTPKALADIETRRTALLRDIQTWRSVQLTYMPCVSLLALPGLIPSPNADDSPPEALAENQPLLLPSALPHDLRQTIPKAVDIERRLREAQCDDALNEIRRQRRILYSVYHFKKLNVSGMGNKPNTRVRAVFDALNVKIQRHAERYRAAYSVLGTLNPEGQWSLRLQPLLNSDIRGPGREADDARNSQFAPSWIWLTPRAPSAVNAPAAGSVNSPTVDSDMISNEDATLASREFDETMRIEWSKSRARYERWQEEAKLVVEEMRRVLEYLNWKQGWWYEQGSLRVDSASKEVLSGLIAYAAKQASLLRALAQDSVELWLPELSRLGFAPDWASKYVVGEGLEKKTRRARNDPQSLLQQTDTPDGTTTSPLNSDIPPESCLNTLSLGALTPSNFLSSDVPVSPPVASSSILAPSSLSQPSNLSSPMPLQLDGVAEYDGGSGSGEESDDEEDWELDDNNDEKERGIFVDDLEGLDDE